MGGLSESFQCAQQLFAETLDPSLGIDDEGDGIGAPSVRFGCRLRRWILEFVPIVLDEVVYGGEVLVRTGERGVCTEKVGAVGLARMGERRAWVVSY